MKQRICEIVKELIEVRKETDLRITDTTIFQESCSIYRGEMAGKSKKGYIGWEKDKKVENSRAKTPNSPIQAQTSKPITKSQRKFLEVNKKILIEQGFKLDLIKNSKDAWKVISEFKKKNNLGSGEI